MFCVLTIASFCAQQFSTNNTTMSQVGPKRARTTAAAGPISRGTQTGNGRGRGRARNKGVMVPRNKLGFPQSMRTKLRYVTRVRLDLPAAGTVEYFTMRGNSIFDPEFPVGGHKPRGTDEYFALYETYTVLGSTCAVNICYQAYDGPVATSSSGATHELYQGGFGTTQSPGVPPVVCLLQKSSDEHNNAATPAAMMEQDKTIWKFITNQEGAHVLKATMAVSEFFGKGTLVGASGYTGTAATNPAEEIFFHVGAARANTSQDNAIVYCEFFITMEYDVVFTEPKKLAAS